MLRFLTRKTSLAILTALTVCAVALGVAFGQPTQRTINVSIVCPSGDPAGSTAQCTIVGDVATLTEVLALAARVDALAAPMTLQQVTDRIDTLVTQRMASYSYLLDYPTYGRFSDDLYYVQTSNGVVMTPRQIAGIVINANLAGLHDHLNDHYDADSAAAHEHADHALAVGETYVYSGDSDGRGVW